MRSVMGGAWLRIAIVLFALAALCHGAPARAAAPNIVSASSDEHVWFVIEQQQTATDGTPRVYRLYHYATAMTGASVSSDATIPALSQYPQAMTAWQSQLWIVNTVEPNQDSPRRDVFTVRVHFDATFNIYQHDPHDRLLAIEPLPAEGRLDGFVALASGPVALLMPTERGTSSVTAPDGSKPSANELAHPRLLGLNNGKWEDIDLPADLPAGASLRIGAGRTGEGELNLLAAIDARHGVVPATTLYQRKDGRWTRSTIPLALHDVRNLTSVLGECAAVVDGPGESASVELLRTGQLYTIAQFHAPDSPWTMLGTASDLRLITRGPVNQVYMQRFDPLSGKASEREQFEAIRPSLAILLHLGVIISVIALTSLLGLGLAKLRGPQVLQLPASWQVLGPLGRAIALLIDLAPAGLVTLFLLRCDFLELINSPIAVPRIEMAGPYLLMTGLTLLHSGIWELMTGTSLGKSMLGAKVTDLKGNRLSSGATVVRLLFKAAVLFVPILIFPTIVSRRGQGLGERATASVVIVKDETAEAVDR